MLKFKSEQVEQEFGELYGQNFALYMMLHAAASYVEWLYGFDLFVTDVARDDPKSVHGWKRGVDTRIAHPDRGDLEGPSATLSPADAMIVAHVFNESFEYGFGRNVCNPEFFDKDGKLYDKPIPDYTTRSHLHWQTISTGKWEQGR